MNQSCPTEKRELLQRRNPMLMDWCHRGRESSSSHSFQQSKDFHLSDSKIFAFVLSKRNDNEERILFFQVFHAPSNNGLTIFGTFLSPVRFCFARRFRLVEMLIRLTPINVKRIHVDGSLSRQDRSSPTDQSWKIMSTSNCNHFEMISSKNSFSSSETKKKINQRTIPTKDENNRERGINRDTS